MIAFDLQCANGHTFEGWFEDSNAYEAQKKKGLIACPVCNSTAVDWSPSPVAIRKGVSPGRKPEQKIDMARLAKQLTDYVETNFDNVGSEFAKEALKIHYGVSEPRNIRGVSTQEEEKTLKEEGVDFFKFPMPTQSDADS